MTVAGSPPGYRPDIDGLRALAVLPVVAFHANIPGFSGGYVGVDIFFVISGFLITGIISREVDRGHFSLLDFYERRARRILPALFAMVGVVLATASVLFLPGDFEKVPPSALAAILFAANFWFFSQFNYFSSAAETEPLLHTWSLGIEEQFYIFFPLTLVAIARYMPRWRTALLTAALLGSLAWSVAVQAKGDGFDFYMLPPRSWELLVGSLLALGAVPNINHRRTREVLALAGGAAIGVSAIAYDAETMFPGIGALPPVLGAALLIHCAPGTLAGRLLEWKPAVWVGLASYSLYLWHWPLIAFTRYAQLAPQTIWQSLGLVALALAMSAASLRWIETPFRDRRRFGRGAIFTLAAAGIAALCTASLALMQLGAWPQRFPPETGRMAAGLHDVSPLRTVCLTTRLVAPDPRCTFGAATAPDALLWGDSHGVELAWVLGQRAAAHGHALAQRTLGSCPPIAGYADRSVPDCATFNRAVLAEVANNPSIGTIYLAGFWAGGRYTGRDTIRLLDSTLAALRARGKQVILIGPVPRQPFEVPRALARAAAHGQPAPLGADLASYRKDSDWFTQNYSRWRAMGVEIIDPASALLQGNHSRILAQGQPLYFDSHHLTLAGARLVLDEGARQ